MNILILGAGVMQIPAIKKAKEMGLFVICADGNKNAVGKKFCDLFYCVDIKDKNGILDIAEKINSKHGLNAVFTAGTDFSTTVAYVTEKLELPGINYQTALNATDKIRMRNCFKEANIPSPRYVEYSKEMDLNSVIENLDYPLVVKPVDSMGARGVKKVSGKEDLKSAIKTALQFSRTSRVIIEEFIDGPEFSLDALVVNGEVKVYGFADRKIMFPPYFIEMGHTIPTDIDEENKNFIITVFSDAVKSLGIDNGVAKGDMKLSAKGPVVGEIAARLSGGYMSGWTYPYSSGIDLTRGAIEIALGRDVTIDKKSENLTAAERAFISIPGIVKEIIKPKNIDKKIKDIFYNINVNDRVIFPRNNIEKSGNVISISNSRADAVKIAEKTASEIIVRLNPSNFDTEEFLFNNNNGLAFDIDPESYINLDESVEIDNEKIYIKSIDKILKSRKKDWQGRTISQVLKQLEAFYTIIFSEDCPCGKDFYQALNNGSLQGVLYYLDSLEA